MNALTKNYFHYLKKVEAMLLLYAPRFSLVKRSLLPGFSSNIGDEFELQGIFPHQLVKV